MTTFFVLLANEWLIFKNTYFRTRRRTLLTLGLLLLALGAMTGITLGAVGVLRAAFAAFGGMVEIVLPLVLNGLFLWLMMAAFSSGVQVVLPRFYRSPDLNLLISLPVSAQALFAARFLFTMLYIPRAQLFLILPILIAAGIVAEAQIAFYALVLPVFFLVCAVPAALSIALIIALVRWFSPKRIMIAGGILGMLSWLFFFVLWGGEGDGLIRILTLLEAAPLWLLRLFPPGMAAESSTAAALGDFAGMILPTAKLLALGAIITVGSLFLIQRLYHRGFARLQEIAPRKKQTAAKPVLAISPKRRIPFLGRWSNLVVVQWQQGLRNHEAALTALLFLLMLIGYVITMALFELPLGPLGSDLILFGHIGVIVFLSNTAVGIFLFPASITTVEANPRIIKERYWLHKVAPLSGHALFWSEWLANFLPSVILGIIALAALNIAVGNGLWISLVSLLVLGALTVGTHALDHGSTPYVLNMDLQKRETVFSLMLFIIFYLLVLGPLTIGQGGYALLEPLRFMGYLPQWALYAATTAFSMVVVILTIYLSAKLGVNHWEKMEM
ncbi:hypothetical protein LM599_05145 [Candidatus Acetothermia bacterium]|nr:hypothetical protein [Candidatus Acetothermia bacterium]